MRWLVALLVALLPVMAVAQGTPAAKPDPALVARADALIAILDGTGDYDAYFAPRFREAVPEAKFATIAGQLKANLGKPARIESLTALSPWSADLIVAYARGTASVRFTIDPAPPHQVGGLMITGTAMHDDSMAKIEAEFRALPGASGFGIYALADDMRTPIAEYNAAAPAPLGSAFKLWVLAEAARQVAAGTRHWADVVNAGPPSLPSGVLQSWPAESPVTLQTLATLMISISDNTATDTLMTTLGRDKVDARATALGGTAPVLTTREAFAIKADAALTAAWTKGSLDDRHALLIDHAQQIAHAPIDAAMFGETPLAVDGVEWFASPAAMAGALDSLRHADDTTRAILAISPGVAPAEAKRFRYIGYKGGSEPGVITMNYVVQAQDGRWYAVTGNWHRPDAGVTELRFAGLMTRLLTQVAAR